MVPACYRRSFPVHLKSHRSHDVVLLCFDCHERASQAADRLKHAIARSQSLHVIPTQIDRSSLSSLVSSAPVCVFQQTYFDGMARMAGETSRGRAVWGLTCSRALCS